ncbi:DUF4336 domain-containing protein [Sorangium cellulosum]|uniref:DUF4336 domain-containing protein n=1 Tax=Sorangium cellulosum TaxID=56 RepID=UPI000CF3723C
MRQPRRVTQARRGATPPAVRPPRPSRRPRPPGRRRLPPELAGSTLWRGTAFEATLMGVPSVFEAVVPDSIWVTERPIWFGGVRRRARTTVVRLSGDSLWVHSPCTPTDDVCAALDTLGEVRWIVVPNRFHHLQTPATAARYPDALVVS